MTKLVLVFMLLSGCSFSEGESLLSKSCDLENNIYPVQSVSYDQDSGEYTLVLLGAPSCFKNPFSTVDLKLGRISEGEKEKAVLDLTNGSEASLLIAADFKINMHKKVSIDGRTEEQSSSWTPFLMSAAGAMAGGYLLNKVFQRPQYVAPPPMGKAGQTVSGVGGYGKTRDAAVKSYQRKYPGKTPALAKKSFFKKKSNLKSGTAKKSFFKRKKSGSLFKSRASRGRSFRFRRR
jgi:hypothetical protein